MCHIVKPLKYRIINNRKTPKASFTAAMFRFLKENFKIPRIDRELGNQGKIYVAFVVDKNGNIKDVNIERSLSPSSDAEALRVIRMMPQWSPGQQGIKKVAVSMIIPIHVKLM